MFEIKTDYEKVSEKLVAVGAGLQQRFENSTEDFEANSQVDFWNLNGKALIVVSHDDGDCGIYPFRGQDGEPIENDLAFIDLLAKQSLTETNGIEEIVFNGILSKDEFFKLKNAVRCDDGTVDEAELDRLVNWTLEKRTAIECLNLLLEGFMTISEWKNGEPIFGLPSDSVEFAELLEDIK